MNIILLFNKLVDRKRAPHWPIRADPQGVKVPTHHKTSVKLNLDEMYCTIRSTVNVLAII